MPVYVFDLPDNPPHGVFLYCPRCGERNSATRGDYFMANPNVKFRCGNHRPLVDMVLAREHRTIEVLDPKELKELTR